MVFLTLSCDVLLDEASFSLFRTFILHSQILCILLHIHDKIASLIIHKAMAISYVLVF